MRYWKECIAEAFEDVGIVATDGQIETVAEWVEGAHENYGLATGEDVASANFISDAERELKTIKEEQEKKRIWELETKPCTSCFTTGIVRDGWGRDITCDRCGGKGRI